MSIHQETLIAAAPQQVYELLTDGRRFSAATEMQAEITDREGDPFSLFGGRIEGRQIELVPGQRVVQAWRFGSGHPSPWEPGVYSTLCFTLEPAGNGTRLVIDHTGIPAKWVDHISSGYPAFYQDPIARFFDRDDFPRSTEGPATTTENSRAVSVALAHVEAWSHHDWDTTRELLAPGVHAWVTSTQAKFGTAELTGIDAYMGAKVNAAQLIEPGSLKVLSAVGDEHNAVLLVTFRIALGPGGSMVTMARSCLYLLDHDQKIKEERDSFYLVP